MKCTDLEILLCDYVDGTLSAAERATVELHLEQCAGCQELVALSKTTLGFIERVAEPEVPAALVNRILFEAHKQNSETTSHRAKGWFRRLLEPVLQPKFAMGMAMTILSFSMLGRFAGLPNRPIRAADLEPARIWATLEDQAYRTWDRAKKYYESLRLVYEVRQTLSDWTDANDTAPARGTDSKQTESNEDVAPLPGGKAGETGEAGKSNPNQSGEGQK